MRIKVIVQRVLNYLHPRSPRRLVSLTQALAHSKTPVLPKSVSNYERVAESQTSQLDFAVSRPLTNEDYILKHDKVKNAQVRFGPQFLFTIAGARILPYQGDIITPTGELLSDFTPRNMTGPLHNAFLRKRYPPTRRLPGRSLSLMTPFANNYYHWMTDALPILQVCADLIAEIDWYIVPRKSSFVMSSLEACGVNPSKVVELRDAELRCEQLVASNIDPAMHVKPNVAAWLRTVFEPHFSQTSSRRKIYASRSDSQERGVKNETQVRDFLSNAGYEILVLSEMSMQDQIAAFSAASHIISVHGAGLTNMAFARQNTKVLEIFPPRWSPVCFLSLAQQVGCQHYYCVAEPLGLTAEQVRQNQAVVPKDNQQHVQSITIPLDKLALFASS